MTGDTVVLSSTGKAAEVKGEYLGEFSKVGYHGGRAYFKQRHTEGGAEKFLFSTGKLWIVGPKVGPSSGYLYSYHNSPFPPTDKWLFHNGTKWESDPTLSLEGTELSPICPTVNVAGEGAVVVKQGSSLGDYRHVFHISKYTCNQVCFGQVDGRKVEQRSTNV